MKKLMIAMMVAGAAVFANAAQVDWTNYQVLLNGIPEEMSGTSAAANQFTVYLYDGRGNVNYSTMLAAVQAGTASDYFTEDYYVGAVDTQAGGAFTASTTATEYGSGTKFVDVFAVIVDKTDKKYAFVVNENTFEVGASSANAMLNNMGSEDYAGYLNATDYSIAGQAGSNWYSQAAVPEPTSGLLLLLGVAGLALKRRRA